MSDYPNNPGPGWEAGLLHLIGAPITPGNVAALAVWHAHEGSNASNNPLNTTWDPTGKSYSAINSDGVRNYPTPQAGLRATATTLLDSPASYGYGPIVAALRAGANPNRIGQLVGASSWGTPAFTVSAGGGIGGFFHDVGSFATGELRLAQGLFGGSLGGGPAETVSGAKQAAGAAQQAPKDAASVPGQIAAGFQGAADTVVHGVMHGILYAALLGLAVVLAIFGLMQLAGVNRQQLAETFRAATPAVAA